MMIFLFQYCCRQYFCVVSRCCLQIILMCVMHVRSYVVNVHFKIACLFVGCYVFNLMINVQDYDHRPAVLQLYPIYNRPIVYNICIEFIKMVDSNLPVDQVVQNKALGVP